MAPGPVDGVWYSVHGISNGKSIIEVAEKFKSLTHSVKVKIVIDNHTNQLLKIPKSGNYYYGSAKYSGYLSGNPAKSALCNVPE